MSTTNHFWLSIRILGKKLMLSLHKNKKKRWSSLDRCICCIGRNTKNQNKLTYLQRHLLLLRDPTRSEAFLFHPLQMKLQKKTAQQKFIYSHVQHHYTNQEQMIYKTRTTNDRRTVAGIQTSSDL